MSTSMSEIAPGIYRIATYVPDLNMQFCQFLVIDDEPMLYHTGPKGMFPLIADTIAKKIPLEKIRHISWSHFEADECGSLNEWLHAAPQATAVTTLVGKLVNIDDFAVRPARALGGDEVLTTGKRRYRFIATPHLPHGWDAGMMFEETTGTLFCSDLFHHFGDLAPLTTDDVIGPTTEAMAQLNQSPLASYMPYTDKVDGMLASLAALKPKTLAIMHGSSYSGDGAKLITSLGQVIKDGF